MNQPVQQNLSVQADDEIDLASYLDLILDNRWLIAAIATVVTLMGAAYAYLATPIYETNILIQVEENPHSSKNILGEMGSLFDVKTAATGEMEILRSRSIVSYAVDKLGMHIAARPKYFPVIGAFLARNKKDAISVSAFEVPSELQAKSFVLTVGQDGTYRLNYSSEGISLEGKVGERLKANTDVGPIELLVEKISAEPGTDFTLKRFDRLSVIKDLQRDLVIAEKGKQSGIIGVSLQGADPTLNRDILNAVGNEYVRRNVDRKSEEAEKSLDFLEKQLPELKQQLEQAENRYNQFRNKMGSVDLGEEAKLLLQQSIAVKTKLMEIQQKRGELLTRQTKKHPDVVAADTMIAQMNGEIAALASQIKKLPLLEQEIVRYTRDVKVSSELYTALLNSAQQLKLVKAGKVGNVRLVDSAAQETVPVKPKRLLIVAISLVMGMFLGVICAFIRKSLFGGIEDAHEIEKALGVSVYASVPHSDKQDELYKQVQGKSKSVNVLAEIDAADIAIESLRSFRTALHFAMLGATNNVVMVTGPTPGIGKSFISVNLAAILAATDKRVLLVDADLRKGYTHQYFGLEKENGLSDLIAGLPVEQAIRKNVLKNVDLITTGHNPPNPSEMLAHPRYAAVLNELSQNYDFVIVDAPPVLVVADTAVIATHAANVFVVARAGVTTTGEIAETVKRLSQNGIATKGILLNDVKLRSGRYGYGYKYRNYRYTAYKY